VFDLARYQQDVAPVQLDDLDFAAFRDQPLPEPVLRCLGYMHDVESHTVCYLRDLLLTPSHRDPGVTAFLTCWNFEEHWHGEALGRVLAAHGEPVGPARTGAVRDLGWRDKVGPWLSAIASEVGEDFVAVHMTWGALNEWSTFAGYQRLSERAGHPMLTELLGRIARQETRHIAFYATEARRRLADSERARRIARFLLRRRWAPVGSTLMPPHETAFVLRYLLSGDDGARAVERIDRHVGRLPGLAGLRVVARAAAAWGVPAAAG
jgi:hypothetical protein